MDRLYLVRHGIAVPPGTPHIEDDLRPLTAKGIRRTRQVARGLRRLGVAVERIVTSPLPRALRTAEIIAKVLGSDEAPERADALRAGESADTIRNWLDGRGEASLMVVGHNPALSELVGLLLLGQPAPSLCQLRKSGIAALVRTPDGGFALDWLATPGMLRRYD